jgi:hypothetical protein
MLAALGMPLAGAQAGAPCKTFHVHRGAKIPQERMYVPDQPRQAALSEAELLEQISAKQFHEGFAQAFRRWPDAGRMSRKRREEALACILFYLQQDSNGNGVPDWTALIDERPSLVLFPLDGDIDGDGVPNVLDPAPFNPKVKGRTNPTSVPPHLKAARADVVALQEELFQKFGILAIDHTDDHSPEVLYNLIFLLKHGFSSSFVRDLKNFRYLYAFGGHDNRVSHGGYHPEAKAISIGGISSYPAEKSARTLNLPLLTTLAHEIGHAFLFKKVAPDELRDVSQDFGGWGQVFGSEPVLSLYSPAFFARHPLLHRKARRKGASLDLPIWREHSLASSYATKNAHEWFADAFAAHILNRMGRASLLGEDWKKLLVSQPRRKGGHWSDYNNISDGLAAWIDEKMSGRTTASAQGPEIKTPH